MTGEAKRKKEEDSFTQGLSPLQLIELDACTQCGECLKYCPVQEVTGNRSVSPPEKIRIFREFIKATEGLRSKLFGTTEIDRQLLEDFTKAIYECTTCGACGENCTVGIFTQRLWPALRKEMVKRGLGPIGPQAEIPDAVRKTGNPYKKPA
jgi:Fe-S oxidoreductase